MRSRYFINLIFLGIFVLGLYALAALHPIDPQKNAKQNAQTAFFENIQFRQFDDKGELKNRFSAVKLNILANQESLFFKPEFFMMTQDHIPWTATSEQAHAYDKGKRIELLGQVHLIQSPTDQSPKTDIRTGSLWFFPQQSQASTQDFIQVFRPGMNIQGKGLWADLKKNHFQLQSQTRGFYTPDKSNDPYHFQSKSLDYDGKTRIITYSKAVKIDTAKDHISADTVKVHTNSKNEIESLQTFPQHGKTIINLDPEK